MDIRFLTQPAPSIEPHIQAQLDAMSPRVFLLWNPRVRTYRVRSEGTQWEGRWEIWCELRHSTHPDATNELGRTDRWNTDAQCWMRKLQIYEDTDGGFAAADQGLIKGLEMADTWANRLFYEDHVRDPHAREEARSSLAMREAAAGSSNYFRNLDSTSVGRHVNSGWRHRIR